jgi:hypothetical protein
VWRCSVVVQCGGAVWECGMGVKWGGGVKSGDEAWGVV